MAKTFLLEYTYTAKNLFTTHTGSYLLQNTFYRRQNCFRKDSKHPVWAKLESR